MRFAIDTDNNRIEVTQSGQRALCPDCNNVVIGRKGLIRPKHWYHKTSQDCDSWYEPITAWHVEWQSNFPKECQEFSLIDEENNIRHRADIYLKNKLVIEVQYSAISINEIIERERFYGKNNMIWILNGENLAKNSLIECQFKKQKISLEIVIPDSAPFNVNYDMDEFRNEIFSNRIISQTLKSKNLEKYSEDNGCFFLFEFKTEENFNELYGGFSETVKKAFIKLYGKPIYKIFEDSIKVIPYKNLNDHFIIVKFEKRYWRKFIDYMTYPVFIDKIRGLPDNCLYWYQKNRIVDKAKFIEKYNSYA